MSSTTDLANKTAIVTGGAGGLGKAIAAAYLAAGANVVIVDISEKLLAAVATELGPAERLHVVRGDVTDEVSVASVIKETVEKFGNLDVLINNAGIMDQFGGVGDLERSLWDRVIAINLTGPTITSKQAINHFLSRPGGGSIINIGSLASLRGGTAGAAYTASKHGLLGLTKNTAAFYTNQGIRANIILPGAMNTNISAAFANGINQKGREIVGKVMAVGPPQCDLEKIGKLVVFLASDAGSVVNGATITTDGGWNAY